MTALDQQDFESTICRIAIETEKALKLLTPEERTRLEQNNPKMTKQHDWIMFEIYSMGRN